jgi:hypothetical protein
MGVRINLDDGPSNKQSVSDAYYGKPRPPQLQALDGHNVLCLKKGKTFIQTDLDAVFLVPADMTSKKVFSSVWCATVDWHLKERTTSQNGSWLSYEF